MDNGSLKVWFLVLAVGILVPASGHKRAVSHRFPGHHGLDKKSSNPCPAGQLLQTDKFNNSVCCKPTACPPGHSIRQCTENGLEDKCEECKPGYLQPNHVSSANMEEAQCFEFKEGKHKDCPSDTKNHSKFYSVGCPYWCVCDIDKCFIGDPCFCQSANETCDVNEEYDLVTNKCVPCKWYAYKTVKGCQRCTINVTLWRLGNPYGTERNTEKMATLPSTNPPIIVTKQEPIDPNIEEKDTSNAAEVQSEDEGSQGNNVPIIAACAAVLFVGIVMAVVVYHCKTSPSARSRSWEAIVSIVKRLLPDKRGEKTDSTVTTPSSELSTLLEEDSDETKAKQTSSSERMGNMETINEKEEIGGNNMNDIQTLYVRKPEQDHRERVHRNRLERSESNQPLIGRQDSVTVDAEVHSSSSNGSYSEEDDVDQTAGSQVLGGGGIAAMPIRSSASSKTLPDRTARPYAGVSTTNRAVPAPGPSLKKPSLESNKDTGICMESTFPEAESNLCRAENAEPSYSRSPERSIGERDVPIGESAPSSIRNHPLLKLNVGIPSDSASNSSVSSPVLNSLSPRITFDDPRKGERQMAIVSPQPRGSDQASPSNTYSSDSINSYPNLHQTFDNGEVSVARMSDFTGQSAGYSYPLHAPPGEQNLMYSNSNNDSFERRMPPQSYFDGRFDPDGASAYDRSEPGVSADNTEVKEVVPESDEYHQTSAKFADPDDTQCKSVDIDKAAGDKKLLKLKHGEDELHDMRPASEEIHAITENSSSVAGENGSLKGRGVSAVMEGEDMGLDEIKGDSELTKAVESDTVASRDELVGASRVLTQTVDTGRESHHDSQAVEQSDGGSQNYQSDDESLELPNSALEQYESKQRDEDTE